MFRRPGSIKLLDIAGIRIGVDATWFLFLFVIIFWLSGQFRDVLHSSDAVAYLTTVVTVLLFFASLIVHELGHAVAARREGITVKRIELFMFGGLTQMSRDTQTPGEELRVAAAGPLGTALVALVCLGLDLAIVGPSKLWHSIELDANAVHITPVLMALSWLLLMNVVILVFNLVPAFPLDGGRIARAFVWQRTGDRLRGTRVAAKIGEGFALLLGAAGLAWLLNGEAFNGIWLMALAFMLFSSARGAVVQSTLSERIEGVRVADIMDTSPVAIPSTAPVGQALDEFFLRYGWSWFPVVDPGYRFVGIARQERVQATLDRGEGWLTVGSVLEPVADGGYSVREDQQLTEVMGAESLGRLGALMAVDKDGILRGVVTVEQIRRALQSAFGGVRPI
jgi:Zn-dependent protease